MGAEGFEHPSKTSGETRDSAEGGANSGANSRWRQEAAKAIGRDLAAALAMIAGLPLTDDEKIQAVRRLLADA
jgi:hypothetical protein